jgi:tetratricopeptide (TPR) repeat protein
VIALDPKQTSAYAMNRGTAFNGKGLWDKAIADFNQVISRYPKTSYAYAERGFAYEKKGDRAKAIADYRQALALSPAPQTKAKLEKNLKRLLAK